MAYTPTYAGLAEPDVAFVEAGGENFRCVIYNNIARNLIEATIFVELPDGSDSIVWSGIVRDPQDDPGGAIVDSPRVLALDAGRFIAHWMENADESTYEIHRAIFNTQQMANDWIVQTSPQTIVTGWPIYDHAIVRDGTVDEFVVAWISAIDGGGNGTITIARYESPYAWSDVVWSVSIAAVAQNRVLSLVADDDADAVVGVAAQSSVAGALTLYQVDSLDGANLASAVVSTGHVDSQYAAVGLAQYPGLSDCVLVAEYSRSSDQTAAGWNSFMRGVLYRDCDLGNGCTPLTSVQYCPNLHLYSRPWIRRNGFPSEYEVFALVGFRSAGGPDGIDEWSQTFGYVVRFNHHEWAGAVPVGTIRPIPCATLSNGAFDGRSAGNSPASANVLVGGTVSRRCNHLSHASIGPQHAMGPDVRNVVVAAMHFEQTVASQDSDLSEGERTRMNAAVKLVEFTHEEPWTPRNDSELPALSATQNFRGASPYAIGRSVEVESGLVFAGGVMSQYDGRQVVETGFLWAPEIVQTSWSGGAIEPGTYWVVATYSWTDRQGVVHRSGPSTPVAMVVDGDGSNGFLYTVRTIPLTMKDDRRVYPTASRVNIEFWRTAGVLGAPEGEAAGLYIFRRVFSGPNQSIQDTPQNDPTVPYITVSDNLANNQLVYNDLLPWQISVSTGNWTLAPPIPTVSARALMKWRNRLFSVPHDDPRVIQYSDEILPVGLQSAAPEHFDGNQYRFDSRGDIVAMHAMDNDGVVWTRDGIYILSGEGNDGSGSNATLILQVIAEGTGCIEERSVVLTPMGLMFQSAKGFYLLNREQQLDHASAGAALSELVRTLGNVRSGTLLEDRHIVRYVANLQPVAGVEQPVILDYNYEQKVWAISPMPTLAGASGDRLNELQAGIGWHGREGQVCHVLLTQGALSIERGDDDTVYADENYLGVDVAIALDVQMEWIHVAGISGLKRIRRIGVQFERTHTSELSFEIMYDVAGDYIEAQSPDVHTPADQTRGYYAFRPRVQKCTAFYLRIRESGTVPSTENIRIVGITIEWARKTKTRRIGTGQLG